MGYTKKLPSEKTTADRRWWGRWVGVFCGRWMYEGGAGMVWRAPGVALRHTPY